MVEKKHIFHVNLDALNSQVIKRKSCKDINCASELIVLQIPV